MIFKKNLMNHFEVLNPMIGNQRKSKMKTKNVKTDCQNSENKGNQLDTRANDRNSQEEKKSQKLRETKISERSLRKDFQSTIRRDKKQQHW